MHMTKNLKKFMINPLGNRDRDTMRILSVHDVCIATLKQLLMRSRSDIDNIIRPIDAQPC
jgi:hypothetical protein